MARLILRDLATNEDFEVPPEGFLFGRVGGDADVQLEDNAISRRQARVSLKNGVWLYETIYVPQGTRPPRPVQLDVGAIFNVGQAEFEVAELEEDAGVAPTVAPGKSKVPPAGKRPNPAPNAKTAPAAPQQKRPVASAARSAEPEEEAAPNDIKAMFAGVPKGIAYYLKNVPLLLVNPIGVVRKTIDEQPNEPLGRTGLIGYALPALLATGLLGAWAAGLALLIGPTHTFSFMAFVPIVPAIGAVIGAVVTGFVFHPLMTWLVKVLKGESDARSRSNYFLQTMTVSIVVAVPNALGLLLAALPIPFIRLLGPLLSVAASLVTFYVTIQWFEFFKVIHWVKKVLLLLGALTVLFAAWGLISGIIAEVKSLGSGSTAVVVDGAGEGDGDDAVPTLDEIPTDPDEARVYLEKKQAQALAASKKMQEAALAAAEKGAATPPPEKPAAKKPAVEAPPPAEEPKEDVKAAPPPEAVDNTPPPPAAGGDYSVFARRRDAVEKAFEANPTLLQRSNDLQKLYGEYLDEVAELDRKYAKSIKQTPDRRRLYERLKEAELSQRTSKTVDALAGKLGLR